MSNHGFRVLLVLAALPLAAVQDAAKAPPAAAAPVVQVEAPEGCEHCGMNRTRFARSRMLVVYADGSKVGTCSLHCMARERREHPDKAVKELSVANRASVLQLVDAATAAWVIGGTERGVMTPVPKWAFASKADAETFIQKNGGRLTGYSEALALATQELGK